MYFNLDDPPEVLALNFPPVEIERKSHDRYIQRDPSTVQTFLYPSNVERREYQFEIAKTCCRYNTLVCLPTSAGKTLIAAVVMLNFYRWYPGGKIIFMAPTCALVNQQISACSSFTNIPESRIIELMGKTAPSKRRAEMWAEKSVFFATPQIVQNDLRKGRLDPTKIVLLVFDEAHHSHGSDPYCNIVRMVARRSSQFRVIGLSATPGNTRQAVQSVIFNLMISKLIFKDEADGDIAKYQQKTDIQRVVVSLGSDEVDLNGYLGKCISSIAVTLQAKGYLSTSDPKFLTRGKVWFEMDKFKKANQGRRDFFVTLNMFSVLMSLAMMADNLTKYGTASLNDALKHFQKKQRDTDVKKKLVNSPPFQALLRYAERAKNQTHPKLAKLSLILEEFFTENPDSRAMVFVQFRAVAYDIANHLSKIPCVRASVFIGKQDTVKNNGLDGELQHEVVSLFRKGNINTIVATSVGEEGLDVGEVDLIVCYDTPSSPLKNVQRMGRTGRRRSGRVIFLMSEGYEEKGLLKAESTRTSLRNELTSKQVKFCMYSPENPVMPLPENLTDVLLRTAHKPTISRESGVPEVKNPTLSKRECHAMKCCFGKKLKYRRVPIESQRNRQAVDSVIISRSIESDILMSLASNRSNELEIPDDIEEQVSKLVQVNSSNSCDEDTRPMRKKDVVSDIFAVASESEDSDSQDAQCTPLSVHLNAFLSDDSETEKPQRQQNFLSDTDVDEIYVSDNSGSEVIEHAPASTSRTFDMGSDSDIDDIDIDELERSKKTNGFLHSDDDLDDYVVDE